MGYTTNFTGKFTCTPALNSDQVAYLKALNHTRRMKRSGASKLPDPLREAGKPVHLIGGCDVAMELDARRAIAQGTQLALTI